jgi:deoxyribodipyrimidine photo-lyase
MRRERIHVLNDRGTRKGRYVVYWMQAAQRYHENPALAHALSVGRRLSLPVVVLFSLVDAYPDANSRHYRFMLQGLEELSEELRSQGIRFLVVQAEPPEAVLAAEAAAAEIVTDGGYLRVQRRWRERIAREARCRFSEVDTNVVVPPYTASTKEEYSAATFRRKIAPLRDSFFESCEPYAEVVPGGGELDFRWLKLPLPDPTEGADRMMRSLSVASHVPPVHHFRGGSKAGRQRFRRFLSEKLSLYGGHRNDPALGILSRMSPYLHFGMVSPVWLAEQVRRAVVSDEAKAEYLEQLVVRRELAVNFVLHNPAYDRYECLPGWARETLSEHRGDPRGHIYDVEHLADGATHDEYWNAAMREMRETGFMHNYMRMYWGKKILEWMPAPEQAFETTLTLNNRYFLDGRDPNSYAGVAWVFGKHDRPWQERRVFGKVRYMNAAGLERKFDIDAYVAWTRELH